MEGQGDGGTALLTLTRQDLIQICGTADGTHLFNTLRTRSWALPTKVSFPQEWPLQSRLAGVSENV